jgi:uncharacterized protein (TIGR00255 family)
MTGFGLAERAWRERAATVRVELRSVNARFLELKLRQPFGVATEHALRKQVERQLGRGRVDVGIHVDESGASSDALAELGVESGRVELVLQALQGITARASAGSYSLTHPSSIDVLRFLVAQRGPGGPTLDEAPPQFLAELVDEACARLVSMREREGEALHDVLAAAYDELEQQVARLRTLLEGEAQRLFDQLATRVRGLLDSLAVPDGALDQRIAQEIALAVQRGDVSEELARIASHLGQARGVLAATPEVGQGKTLDFLAQELLREVTTIGSKITSHEGSATVIAAKRTIERIREQVQNVE